MSMADIERAYRLIIPQRDITPAIMGFPFPQLDFAAANDYVLEQGANNNTAGMYYIIHPETTVAEIEEAFEKGFVGLKPYRYYSSTGDIDNCGIGDMITTEQVGAVNAHRGVILLHVAKKEAIADPQNLKDIQNLSKRYPDCVFILAHCGRCFIPELLDKTVDILARLGNVYVDTSAVTFESVFQILFERFALDRIIYGSDCAYPGWDKGTFVRFGYSWGTISEDDYQVDMSHCDGRFTFLSYENLRALLAAGRFCKLTEQQLKNIFFDNADKLLNNS